MHNDPVIKSIFEEYDDDLVVFLENCWTFLVRDFCKSQLLLLIHHLTKTRCACSTSLLNEKAPHKNGEKLKETSLSIVLREFSNPHTLPCLHPVRLLSKFWLNLNIMTSLKICLAPNSFGIMVEKLPQYCDSGSEALSLEAAVYKNFRWT